MSDGPFRTVELSDPRFERDGLRVVTVKSVALGARGDLTVFVPRGLPADATEVPLVILLHGVYGSHWVWALKGGAHRTAQRLIDEGTIPPMVLAMPSDGLWGDGSGYLPHRLQDFERWIALEVPLATALAAPVVTAGSPLLLSGLSMGGFGALRIGVKYANKFRALSAHSSLTHFDQMKDFVEEHLGSFMVLDKDRSVLDTIDGQRAALPAIRFDCGREDPLIGANRELHRALMVRNIPHVYEEFAGGHSWHYWEEHFVDALHFFAGVLNGTFRKTS